MTTSMLLEKTTDTQRRRVARPAGYDPNQRRDGDGQWTDGDPLDVAKDLTDGPDKFRGSARVGDGPDATGVNIVATEADGDVYFTITTGTASEARLGDGHADDYSILADEQIRKLQPKLKKALTAAENGQPFESKLDGEDNGDVIIGAADGKVTVSARSWGWDEPDDEEDLRPPLMSRDEFDETDWDMEYSYDDYLAEHAAGEFDEKPPEPTPPSWKTAELTVAQAQELLSDVKRLAAPSAVSNRALEPGGRPMTAPVLFAKAAQSRLVLARACEVLEGKYNPDQKRDDEGKWAAFGGVPAFAKKLLVADGEVDTTVDGRGVQVKVSTHRGGSNSSGKLDRDSALELSRHLEFASEFNSSEDDVDRYKRTTHAYDREAPDFDPSTAGPMGFAEVDVDDRGVELELFTTEDRIKLTKLEAAQLADVLDRASGSSRVSTPGGPVDLYPADNQSIGLRLKNANGEVVEPQIDSRSWGKLKDGINAVYDGTDHGEQFGHSADDEIDTVEFDSNVGRMRVHRAGAAGHPNDADYGAAVLSFGPADGSWKVSWNRDFKDPMWGALDAVEAYAAGKGWPGIENSLPVVLRAEAPLFFDRVLMSRRRIAAHLPGKHPQESHAGDGPDLDELSLVSGMDVTDQDGYHRQYGDFQDEQSVDLGDGYGLTVRYFERGDAHVVIDMPGDHYQVLEDMDPESMRRLAYDIDDALAADLDEPDDSGIAFDIDSEAHSFYIARDETGDVRLHPGGFDADHLNLSEDDAAEFAEALRDMADGYEDHFEYEGVENASPRRLKAHLPDKHDQKTHGRRKKKPIPDVTSEEPQLSEPAASGKKFKVTVAEALRFDQDSGRLDPDTEAALKEVYTGTFGGLRAEALEAMWDPYSDETLISGKIFNADGVEVGQFDRTLSVASDGRLQVGHELLALNETVQGQGFATEFNAHAFEWYRESGVDDVKVHADIDVGGYTWARQGYDWAHHRTVNSVAERILGAAEPDTSGALAVKANMDRIPDERLAEQRDLAGKLFDRMEALSFESPDFPTPFEISQLGRWEGAGRDDWWVGKAIMMGSDWRGVITP